MTDIKFKIPDDARAGEPESLRHLHFPAGPADFQVGALDGFGVVLLPKNIKYSDGGQGWASFHPAAVWLLRQVEHEGRSLNNLAESLGLDVDSPLRIKVSSSLWAGLSRRLWRQLVQAVEGHGPMTVQVPDRTGRPTPQQLRARPHIFAIFADMRAAAGADLADLAERPYPDAGVEVPRSRLVLPGVS